jgi:hypothetical protein
MRPILIALLGRAGSGKTTAANFIKEKYENVEIVSFANPLKKLAKHLWDFTDDQVYGDYTIKEQLDPRVGISPRTAMQRLGDGARTYLSGSIWIDSCLDQLDPTSGKLYVIEDCRYLNEVKAINDKEDFNGHVIRLVCPDNQANHSNHPSEAEVDLANEYDLYTTITSKKSPNAEDLKHQLGASLDLAFEIHTSMKKLMEKQQPLNYGYRVPPWRKY